MAILACRAPICIFTIVWKILTIWAVLLVLANAPGLEELFGATCHYGKAELNVPAPIQGALVAPNLPVVICAVEYFEVLLFYHLCGHQMV